MYPPVLPHDLGMLETADGSTVYWEESGNPHGIPALYLHGGPGGALRPGYRRRFDPARFRIIGLQQRGAGLSTPHASSPEHRRELTTTPRLLDDIDALRHHLGIEKWLVSGVSWGSTLALHHALRSPEAVAGLVLVAVTTTSPQEIDWITEGVQILYPEAWDRLASTVEALSGWRRGSGRLIDAVAEIMACDDGEARTEMAVAWMDWETSHIQIGLPLGQVRPVGLCEESIAEQIAFTELVSHHWSRHAALDPAWVPSGGVLAHLPELAGIPLCMVHGRRDVSGPMSTPWAIKKALPEAVLHVVAGEGHGGDHMMELWTRATDSFADHGDFSSMVPSR